MCDACTNEGFNSPPDSPERMEELRRRTEQRVLQYGHEVVGVYPGPDDDPRYFYYTVGRSASRRPELLLTGALPPNAAMIILNDIAAQDRAGKIDLVALADLGQPVEIENFDARLKFIWADPEDAEMFQAINYGGPGGIRAIQVLWPDPQGRFPDNPDFDYTDTQTLHPLAK